MMGTDVVASGITVAGDVFSGLWGLATSNAAIMVIFGVSLVGVGFAIYYSIKSKLSGRGRKRK